jgi:cell division protein ZapB
MPPGEVTWPSSNDLAERVDRLLLRHEELKRTSALLLEQQLATPSPQERDSLRSRLSAARRASTR